MYRRARRGRPPRLESTKHRLCPLPTCSNDTTRTCYRLCPHFLQSNSLSFFIGRQRTVFEAGFALKTQGSLVKGLKPLRAFVAGLFFSFMLSMPASLKEPDFFTCSTATPISASTTPFTSFDFSPVVSATDWNTPVCVIAPPAFIAFIAFIA